MRTHRNLWNTPRKQRLLNEQFPDVSSQPAQSKCANPVSAPPPRQHALQRTLCAFLLINTVWRKMVSECFRMFSLVQKFPGAALCLFHWAARTRRIAAQPGKLSCMRAILFAYPAWLFAASFVATRQGFNVTKVRACTACIHDRTHSFGYCFFACCDLRTIPQSYFARSYGPMVRDRALGSKRNRQQVVFLQASRLMERWKLEAVCNLPGRPKE